MERPDARYFMEQETYIQVRLECDEISTTSTLLARVRRAIIKSKGLIIFLGEPILSVSDLIRQCARRTCHERGIQIFNDSARDFRTVDGARVRVLFDVQRVLGPTFDMFFAVYLSESTLDIALKNFLNPVMHVKNVESVIIHKGEPSSFPTHLLLGPNQGRLVHTKDSDDVDSVHSEIQFIHVVHGRSVKMHFIEDDNNECEPLTKAAT